MKGKLVHGFRCISPAVMFYKETAGTAGISKRRKETKMNKLIEDLIKKGMGNFMDRSRDELARSDETYLNDCRDGKDLEQRYESLDLSKRQRIVINDYMACTSTASHRYADISYMCGIKDTVRMLVSLGLIKGVEAEE